MGILSGALSVRRYRVVGDLPTGWRERYRDSLEELSFKEPPGGVGKEEVEGWVQVHNLLDTDFQDFNRWLYNEYVLLGLRVDKKRLPAKLFKATVDKRCDAWKEEQQIERVPATKRTQIREDLEEEWLKRSLPSVAMTEAVWNVDQGWLVLHAMSDGVSDRFRKRFFRTFGMRLVPWSPLDHCEDDAQVDRMLSIAPTVFATPEGATS